MEKAIPTDYSVGDLVYDALIYDGHNTFSTDLAFYKKWMPKDKAAPVLELCCGSGRLTIPLAKEGVSITGVDMSQSMLAQAAAKAKQEGMSISFIEADIRTLDLPHTYDCIFIPFNSIHHLYTNKDLFDVLEAVNKHLTDNGLFIMDCFNPSIQHIVEGEKIQTQIAAYKTLDEREIVIEQSMKYDSSTQVNRIKWQYFINGAFHSTQNVDMRMFFPQELDAYLIWHGFETIHKFGSFEESAFDDTSDKQIFICKKMKR